MTEESTPDVEVRSPEEPRPEVVQHPAKLLRIASMVRELLEEARQVPLDEGARKRLSSVYDRSLGELKEILSEDLRAELDSLAQPFDGVPSEPELRIAQAQLVGWLEGLFHGIQAALVSQQLQTRAQLEELRRRSLPPGEQQQPDPHEPPGPTPPGQYI